MNSSQALYGACRQRGMRVLVSAACAARAMGVARFSMD
jgi:hypothetical protein